MINQTTASAAAAKPVAAAFFSRIEVPQNNKRYTVVKICLVFGLILLLSIVTTIPWGSIVMACAGMTAIVVARCWQHLFSVGLLLKPDQFVLGTRDGFPCILRGETKIRRRVLERLSEVCVVQEHPWIEHRLQIQLNQLGTYELSISLLVLSMHAREAVYWLELGPGGVEQVIKRELARLVSHRSDLREQLEQNISNSREFVGARVQATIHRIEPWIEPLEIEV